MANQAMAWDGSNGQVVLFGGYILSQGRQNDDTWLWDGVAWWTMGNMVRPRGRSYAAMCYDLHRRKVVLFGGDPGGGGALNDTWEWDGTTWNESLPAHRPPGHSSNARMAFDAVRGVTVLFGLGTWLWNGTDWSQATVMEPAWRVLHRVAFDERRGVIVLFGGTSLGSLLNDTWEWDGTRWQEVGTPTFSPRPRHSHMMAYDAERGRVVMHGGFLGLGPGFSNETWEWDGDARIWRQLAPLNVPPVKANADMAYDYARGRLVLFAGLEITPFTPVNTTWTLLEVPLRGTPVRPLPGQSVALSLSVPQDPSIPYVLACSFNRAPGLPVGGIRLLSLSPDPLLLWSLGSLVTPFLGFLGALDGTGTGQASIQVPSNGGLTGTRFFTSGLTFGGAGVRTVFNEVEVVIGP